MSAKPEIIQFGEQMRTILATLKRDGTIKFGLTAKSFETFARMLLEGPSALEGAGLKLPAEKEDGKPKIKVTNPGFLTVKFIGIEADPILAISISGFKGDVTAKFPLVGRKKVGELPIDRAIISLSNTKKQGVIETRSIEVSPLTFHTLQGDMDTKQQLLDQIGGEKVTSVFNNQLSEFSAANGVPIRKSGVSINTDQTASIVMIR